MDKKLNEILIEILKFPDIPKPYRDLKKYYLSQKKTYEYKCIENFLLNKFEEIPDLNNDNDTYNNKKQ